jgi:hypothetical protein
MFGSVLLLNSVTYRKPFLNNKNHRGRNLRRKAHILRIYIYINDYTFFLQAAQRLVSAAAARTRSPAVGMIARLEQRCRRPPANDVGRLWKNSP